MIDKKILNELIEIGKKIQLGIDDYTAQIIELKDHEYINIIGPSECKEIAKKLNVDDLYFLISTIVISESENNWTGGSVAASIWLFRELQSINYEKSIKLANWILPRTKNYYVPFGFNNYNASNYDEYIEICRKRNLQFTLSEKSKEQQEVDARKEREIKRLQKNISNSDRKSTARKELIEHLNKIPIHEQIKELALDQKYAISFYPTSIVTKVTDDVIKMLEQELIERLLIKLKGRQKGPWAKFKRKLFAIHFKDNNLPWNRKPWQTY